MTHKLPIKPDEIAFALQNHSYEAKQYLDLETGKIIMITADNEAALDEILDAVHDDALALPDFSALLAQSDLQDWQQMETLEAYRIKVNVSGYLLVEPDNSYDGYNDMENFIETAHSERVQERLWDAIQGKGAFRRFKDVLLDYPAERERWFAFKETLMRQRAVDFLADNDIIALNEE
ncbi:MAG TPA: hypothetical protein G4N96_14140 [Chloroflexi bacterium]|nr:MAG: hypothetical protein B6243_02300 [Anaerolineaceae bacterium 4572_5.2]HEY86241.1 hypothetical protein [Chloroflexota bacterium]